MGKNIGKKLVSALFVLSLLLTACSGNSDSSVKETVLPDTTEQETEAETYTLNIPDIDYESKTFTILTGEYMSSKTTTFSVDEDNGDTLNSALYKRNLALEERFNMKIEEIDAGNAIDPKRFKTLVDSGDDSFDISLQLDRNAFALAIDGYVTPYGDLPNINLDNPWWYQNITKELTIGKKLFFTFGYYDLSSFDTLNLLLFNKKYITDYKLDNPYELVRSGKWTIDKLYSMMAAAQTDVDGDGEMTDNDIWGANCYCNQWYNSFVPVSGTTIVAKDSDDLPYLNVLDNDLLISIWQKVLNYNDNNLYFNMNVVASKLYGSKDAYVNATDMFKDGHSLFTGTYAKLCLGSARYGS